MKMLINTGIFKSNTSLFFYIIYLIVKMIVSRSIKVMILLPESTFGLNTPGNIDWLSIKGVLLGINVNTGNERQRL